MAHSTVQLVVRTASGLQVRSEPVRVSWTFDDLVASDGHKVRCTFTAALRALDKPAELQMLCESLMQASASVTAETIRSQWLDPLRSAAAAIIQTTSGEQATSDAGRPAIVAALSQALARLAFAGGIEVLPPCQVDAESPTLVRQRVEAMRQQAAQQRAANQIRQIEQMASMLSRFEQLRQEAPTLSVGRLLQQVDPAEQGEMLESLLLASSQKKQTPSIWAVAGSTVVELDPREPGRPPRLHPMPPELGPLRSVNRCDDGTLLIGARGGVYELVPGQNAPPRSFAAGNVVSQMGFGHALRWGREIWACHSEAGIAGWTESSPLQPQIFLPPAQLHGASPRNLAALDGNRLVFSSGPRLMMLLRQEGDSMRVSICGADCSSDIIAVLHAGDTLVLALRNGDIELREIDDLDLIERRTVAGAVSSACLLPWLGEWRVLLAEETGPVTCAGLNDTVISRFSCSYRGLKALAAAADIVAGVTADRQRLVWWRTASPSKLCGDAYLMPTCKHRAADVAT